MTLQVGELDVEDLNGVAVLDQLVALGETEEPQDLLGGWMRALPLLGVQGEFDYLLPCHGQAKLTLDEGLNKQCKEVQGEQCLDPALVLEEDGRDLVHGLDLLEALLDHGLALVGQENLGR